MAQTGTVTITARVNASQAETALKSLGAAAKRISVDYRSASQMQANTNQQMAESFRRVTRESESLVASIGKIAAGTALAHVGLSSLQQALATVGGSMQFAIAQAAQYESSMKTLEIVSRVTGGSFKDAKALIDEFSDSISSPAAVASAVRVFQSMNMSMDDQRRLIKGIRDGLVAMGMDVNEQLPLMALAIKRQESALLDNMGVTRTIEMMYKEYAKTLGTTVDRLTQEQKEQAVVNGVLKETAVYAGTAESSTETYAGSVNNLKAAQRELGKEIGEVVNPALTAMNNLLADATRNMAAFVRATPKNLLEIGRGLTEQTANAPVGAANRPRFVGGNPSLNTEGGGLVIPGLGIPNSGYKIAPTINPQAPAGPSEEELRKAKRLAEMIAADQKRLREKLQRDLSLIDKQGYDRERQEAINAHLERLKLAHGDAELMRQSRTIYYKQIADIDRREQAEDLKRLEDWQRERRALRADDMSEGFESTLAEIRRAREDRKTEVAAKLEPMGPLDTREQVEGQIKRINELLTERNELTGELVLNTNQQVAAMQQIEELNGRLVKMDADRARSWEDIAASAITAAGSLASQAIRNGGVSGGDVSRGLAGTIGGIIGTAIAPGIGTAIGTTAGNIIGDIVGAAFDRHDEAARLQEKAAEEQRRAAEEQLMAARERQQKSYDVGSFIDQQYRELNWERMLAEARGTDRFEEVQTQVEMMRAIEKRVNDFRRALGLISQASGGHESWMLDEFAKQVKVAVYDGSLSAEDRRFLESGRYGDIFRDAMSSGHGGLLLDAIQNLADAIALETSNAQNRVLPGSSPQNPSYNVIVNFKDMWAYAPKDALYRASSPGTRRDDSGSERGINVGGRR